MTRLASLFVGRWDEVGNGQDARNVRDEAGQDLSCEIAPHTDARYVNNLELAWSTARQVG